MNADHGKDHVEQICIVGAGGIGCAVGYGLAKAGFRPLIVDANTDKVKWGQANGLVLDRQMPLSASFVHFDEWQPQPGAVILLCTKCYDNQKVLSHLGREAIVIPIQNGFDPLLERSPDDIEGIASFVSECDPARTATRITRRGSLHMGAATATGVRWPGRGMLDLAGQLRAALSACG